MRFKAGILFLAIFYLVQFGVYADDNIGGLIFNLDSSKQILLPKDIQADEKLIELDYDDGEAYEGINIDLNLDEKEEYFIRSSKNICGTGGCIYLLFDGSNHRLIGEFFGSLILIKSKKINGFPIIVEISPDIDNPGVDYSSYSYKEGEYVLVDTSFIPESSREKLENELKMYKLAE